VFLREEPERLADPKARAFLPVWGTSQPGVFVAVNNSVLRGDWFDQLASIRSAHSRGVKLLAGTDKVFPWRVLAGLSLHWELEHLVEAGLTPLEVLRIATRDAAEAVGAQDNLGTLDAGKLADIVLLDRNPLENIKNTQTIWRVLEDGRLFDPEKLRPPVPVGKAK
jgi:imidazolonepropionase-like amidohydrolase